MNTEQRVQVEVYDFNRDAWTLCEFLGSRPGSVQVKAPNGVVVWFASNVVRFVHRQEEDREC